MRSPMNLPLGIFMGRAIGASRGTAPTGDFNGDVGPGPLCQLRQEPAEASKTLKWIGEPSFLANSPKKLRVLTSYYDTRRSEQPLSSGEIRADIGATAPAGFADKLRLNVG